jgi:hypothetical protein
MDDGTKHFRCGGRIIKGICKKCGWIQGSKSPLVGSGTDSKKIKRFYWKTHWHNFLFEYQSRKLIGSSAFERDSIIFITKLLSYQRNIIN